jgi:hypothetical protein
MDALALSSKGISIRLNSYLKVTQKFLSNLHFLEI